MSKSLQLLNAVQAYLVNFANENGINLAEDFESVDAFKQFVMALTFKTAVDAGFTVQEAFDAVAGEGAYDDLVETVWERSQA